MPEAIAKLADTPAIHFTARFVDYRLNCFQHGAQVIKVIKGSQSTPVCPLCQAEEEERQRAIADKERRVKQYTLSNVARQYWQMDIDSYKATTKNQARAKEAIARLIEERHGKVVLLGGNGVGKTMLGSIAVMALGGYCYSAYEIALRIRACYMSGAKESEYSVVQELSNAPMLFIDELGRSRGTDSEQLWLNCILDKRHANGKPFIIASNAHPLSLCPNRAKGGCSMCFEHYVSDNIMSRLKEDTNVIVIDGHDMRGTK